ncbi:MAG: response regulator [Anaerovibrio sp.]|nr:response regulator [Anaerovibrio sp.]
MSDMNGVEIIRQLRRFVDDEIPMVLITDGNCSDFVDEVVDLGTLGFLSKPIFASDVKSLISSTMNGPSDKFEAPSIVKEADFIGRRILLAEDNKMNQEIAITILEDAGFFVDLAEDGEIAVNKVINHPGGYYDLVLMDIKMPVMDGYEATKRIRGMSDESKKDVPIIAMTADAFSADRQLALECGMNEHITKPVDIDRLFSVLKSVVK